MAKNLTVGPLVVEYTLQLIEHVPLFHPPPTGGGFHPEFELRLRARLGTIELHQITLLDAVYFANCSDQSVEGLLDGIGVKLASLLTARMKDAYIEAVERGAWR